MLAQPLWMGYPMMPSTPALDFLRRVEVWQKTEGGTAGVGVAMPAGEETTLDQLLANFRRTGPTAALEEQARYWLIGYRETERFSPTLTTDQKNELDAVIARLPSEPVKARTRRGDFPPPDLHVARWPGDCRSSPAASSVLHFGIPAIWHATHPANNVPTVTQGQQAPPAQQVPPANTDLQNFKSDWGPWAQLPVSQQNPFSGAPALLYMEQGNYYVSKSWTIPANSPAWTPDLGGNVGNEDVEGNHALITDQSGGQWTVTINQPFVFSQNPGSVLRIDPTGKVYTIPEAHATSSTVRKHLP